MESAENVSGPVFVNHAAVKLPSFSISEPLTWFRRAEVQFRLKGVKRDGVKADLVLESLPDSVFRKISPWLDNQDAEISYEE